MRSKYSQVVALVLRTKKIFVKAPARIMQFMSMGPGASLPPEPVIMRWGTWIDATIYYCSRFQVVKSTVDSMKMEDKRASEAVQEQFLCSEMEGQLPVIKLKEGLNCLQEKGATPEDSLALVKRNSK